MTPAPELSITQKRESANRVRARYDFRQFRLAREREEQAARDSDMLIGALHVAGKLTPKLITRALVASMRTGSILVDVAIDQGGISETSRASSHSNAFLRR